MDNYQKNQEFSKGTISPMDAFNWIEREFFQYLEANKTLTEEQMQTFTEKYKLKFAEIEVKVKHLIKNELDKGNVFFTLIAVAAYDTFLEIGFSKEEALLYTDECINKPGRSYIIDGTRKMLDYSSDPYQSLVTASKEREQNFFGESFEFYRQIDNEYGYVLHVKKCLFHLVLEELNRQELQHSLCRMDLGWINGIIPEKHNLQFVRPITFATGNTCQMWFMKKEKELIKD